MVKLVEGNEMQQLHIEVYSMPSYYMNIEECMNVKVEIDEKPWCHDIKAYIKDGEYSSGATDGEKKFIRQFFLVEKSYIRGTTIQLC